jgi:hypothetical protein
MNSYEILNEHALVHYQVSEYAKKPDGSLKAADLQEVGKCGLGKWVSTDGVPHSGSPEYEALKQAHARFHKASADTVKQADAAKLPDGWLSDKGELKVSLAGLFIAVSKMSVKVG